MFDHQTMAWFETSDAKRNWSLITQIVNCTQPYSLRFMSRNVVFLERTRHKLRNIRRPPWIQSLLVSYSVAMGFGQGRHVQGFQRQVEGLLWTGRLRLLPPVLVHLGQEIFFPQILFLLYLPKRQDRQLPWLAIRSSRLSISSFFIRNMLIDWLIDWLVNGLIDSISQLLYGSLISSNGSCV